MERLESSLRSSRERAGLSQGALAAACGISRQAYAAIERGASVPSTEVALRLARALGATVDALFRLAGPPGQARADLIGPSALGPAPVRADVQKVGDRWVARPLDGSAQRPAVVRSLSVANAMVQARPGSAEVDVELLDPPDRPTLVVVGCDPAMSVVAAHLREHGVGVSWHEMGSDAALAQLAMGAAHVAGCHMRDHATGEYNLPLVARRLASPATVVTFAVWDQGLVVAPGNPKRIRGVEDLARAGVSIVNREDGSASRALLESAMASADVSDASVAGFDRTATSHLSVAEGVGMGLADAGVAVRAAAVALGLDFVPLAQERYDLVIPNGFLELRAVAELLAALRRPALRRQVEALGGYDVAPMGTEPAAA